MATPKAILNLEQLESRDVPASTLLGPADPYNVMVFGNFSSQNSDTQGAVAVGGNANFSAYSVGAGLPGSFAGVSLVVGGNLTFTNGQVANGSAEVGGSVNTSQFGIPHGTILSGQYLNFSSDQSQLDSISAKMASTPHNGTVTNYYGNFTLTGTSSGTNVFVLTAAQLANCHGMTIKAPKGSSVIIDVSGANVSMQNFGINLSGVSSSNVVWNFYQAKSLTMSSIGIQGNVLAPYASVSFNNGQINGTLVAQNFCGTGQVNWVPPPAYCDMSSIAGCVTQTCQYGTIPAAGVTVTLCGMDSSGHKITQTMKTDMNGVFDFLGLPAGTYTITISFPAGDVVTSSAGSSSGTPNGASITNIPIGNNVNAVGYHFNINL